MISVIIPCYNEVKTIEAIVDKVLAIKQYEIEIIIIDDFSNDGTTEILKTNLTNKAHKIIFNEQNFGKGYCIKKRD